MTIPCINSLWPSDTIGRKRSESRLVQVMAYCLMAPSRYLNQCWLISYSDIHLRAISQEKPQPRIPEFSLKINYLTFHSNLPEANELPISTENVNNFLWPHVISLSELTQRKLHIQHNMGMCHGKVWHDSLAVGMCDMLQMYGTNLGKLALLGLNPGPISIFTETSSPKILSLEAAVLWSAVEVPQCCGGACQISERLDNLNTNLMALRLHKILQ